MLNRRNPAKEDDLDFALLRALGKNPRLSQRGIAKVLGVSLGGAHTRLNRLVKDGALAVEQGQNPAVVGVTYALTSQGEILKATLATGFIDRTRAEIERLQTELDGLEQDFPETFSASMA